MNNECQNCVHAHLWSDEKVKANMDRFYEWFGRFPVMCDRYDCDKIAEGTEWTEDGKTYKYDGYSLDGECYDDVFHCFEPKAEGSE